MSDIELKNLPMHALRSKAREMNLPMKNTTKKDEIIAMILNGGAIEEKKEKKVLKLEKREEKIVALLPPSVAARADQMKVPYHITEIDCCVTFKGRIPVTTTLDQSEANIMAALQSTMVKSLPPEKDTMEGSFV